MEQVGTTMKQPPTTQCILLAGTIRGKLGDGEMEELRHMVVGCREDTDRLKEVLSISEALKEVSEIF